MRILWISTKPPWPPVDGGRLAQALTLEALAREKARVTVVTPDLGPEAEAGRVPQGIRVERVATRLRPRVPALAVSLTSNRPAGVVRHSLRAVRRRVAEELERAGDYDVVHVEQVHAWPQSEPALTANGGAGVPRVLRTQNVESDLTRAAGGETRSPGWVLRREARRMERYEARVVAEADAAVALTAEDAERLAELAGRPVETVPPPFPTRLPDAGAPLPGDPALVVLGGSGWWPNREATRRLAADVWPVLARRLPGAVLHLFGTVAGGDRITVHPPPDDSRRAFAPGSILLVPLRSASGLRMKVLEAWSRGVPVVATPTAARGLGDAVTGDEPALLIAPDDDPETFTEAVARLHEDDALRRRIVHNGRAALARDYDAGAIACRLLEIYRRSLHAAG